MPGTSRGQVGGTTLLLQWEKVHPPTLIAGGTGTGAAATVLPQVLPSATLLLRLFSCVYGTGSQPGVILLHGRHWAVSDNIWGCHRGRGGKRSWHRSEKTRLLPKPTAHVSAQQRRIIWANISSAEAEKPGAKVYTEVSSVFPLVRVRKLESQQLCGKDASKYGKSILF